MLILSILAAWSINPFSSEPAVRVLIADSLSSSVVTNLEKIGCTLKHEASLQGPTLGEAIVEFNPEVLVVRSTRVEAEHFNAANSLSLVIRAGAGTNTIDLATASGRGIYVANCPGKNAIAVAELAMGHLLNADRRIADNVLSLREHRWAKKKFSKAKGLYGRTLAVLGGGRIGQELLKRAQGFGMDVRLWSRSLTPERAEALGVTFAATPLEACTNADFLSVHLPANESTFHLINESILEALNPGACVVNTSRGSLVDSQALLAACRAGKLKAGLDVFEDEPSAGEAPFSDPLADEENVYGTHHIGASTDQASEAVGDEVFRIIEEFQSSGLVVNCVNLAKKTQSTHLLVVRHADEIGVLALILDALSEARLNVQKMENIIFAGSGAACARIQLSAPPPQATLEGIQQSPHILATTVLPL